MKRIAIVGPGGAGKSTLARQLGVLLHLPVIHLDREFWQPGWVMTPLQERRGLEAQMIAGDRWIIDGNYGATMGIRLTAADTVVFLDLHPLRCMARALWRGWSQRGRTRPDMGPGCAEQLPDREFLTWIATYRWRRRPQIRQSLARLPPPVEVRVLQSPRQVRRFLDEVERRVALGTAALAAAMMEAEAHR